MENIYKVSNKVAMVKNGLLIFMIFLSETLILLSTTKIGFGWTYGSLDFSTLQT